MLSQVCLAVLSVLHIPLALTSINGKEVGLLADVYVAHACQQEPRDGVLRCEGRI